MPRIVMETGVAQVTLSRQYAIRLIILFLAGALYSVIAALSITRGLSHFELISLGVQAAFLLPALVYILYSRENAHGDSEERGEWPGSWKRSVMLWICLLGFILTALLVSYHVSRGIVFADESSYRFQARAFGELTSAAPAPPGSPSTNSVDTPWPLAFKHLIIFHSEWFSKYPLGWPVALALPEKLNVGWMATPLLGGIFLVLLGEVARESFGKLTIVPAVAMGALSPYCLAQCVGRMSHALCAVLIATACWFCLRGIRKAKLSQFVFMFLALGLSFHVRPYTAFIVSAVLGLFALWHCRKDRPLLVRVMLVGLAFAMLAVVSVLLYNRAYTGSPFLSPYALYDGLRVPKDISATPSIILDNLLRTRRFSMQTTLLYSFPFVFVLAVYGFWLERKSAAARILACLFPAIFLGHLIQTFTSSPIVGERYFFEAYFSVVVLAARGVQGAFVQLRTSKPAAISAVAILASIQAVMTAVAVRQLAVVGQPYHEVTVLAEHYQDCHCAVFLKSSEALYSSDYMNLNTPAWKSAEVFYLNDPGPDQRRAWARLFGWSHWVVIGYNEQTRLAYVLEN